MRVCVTGGRGMLGSDVCRAFERSHEVVPFDIEDFDVVEESTTRRRISSAQPDLVIHCAAYTDVDRAESDSPRAHQVNGLGTKNVALACSDCDAALLYISTDYVFDGKKKTPYLEEDTPKPLNVYGASKLEGEEWVHLLASKSYIVRASWLYGKSGRNFIWKVLQKSKIRSSPDVSPELAVVDDQVGSPTYTLDLANSIEALVSTGRYGLYHIANAGHCSWYQFAEMIFRFLHRNVELKPIRSRALRQPATRPAFSAIESSIWGRTVGEGLRHWSAALEAFLSSIQADAEQPS